MKYAPSHLSRWTRPSSYFGATWPEYFVFLSRNRDSDELTESNFETAIARLEALPDWTPPDSDDEAVSRYVVRESHWACGWVEWIAIHETDTEALKAADEMAADLESYPVLDEEDLSRREDEEAQRVWRDCYDVRERADYVRKFRNQFNFCDWRDVRAVIRGDYFTGYASELIH